MFTRHVEFVWLKVALDELYWLSENRLDYMK